MKILVTGATGTVGREVALRLAGEHAAVYALVRDPDRARDLEEAGVRPVPGHFEAPATLDAALAGIERVLLLSPLDPRQVELQGNVVEAAKRAGRSQSKTDVIERVYQPAMVPMRRWPALREHQSVASVTDGHQPRFEAL